MPRLPVAVQVPVAGSYSSALLKVTTTILSPRHQHLAIGQQRRRVIVTCGAKAAGGRPRPVAGSYSSALLKSVAIGSPRHQHLAIGQQRRRVTVACGAKAAGRRPGASRRIIQLRAAQGTTRHCFPPPPAPCHWAAASPCERHVRCQGCRSPSTSRSPDHTAPRCSSQPPLYPPATSTLPLGSSVAV